MPQLMPLSWGFSNFVMLVILIVMCSMYGASYYSLCYSNNLDKNNNFFMILWW